MDGGWDSVFKVSVVMSGTEGELTWKTEFLTCDKKKVVQDIYWNMEKLLIIPIYRQGGVASIVIKNTNQFYLK